MTKETAPNRDGPARKIPVSEFRWPIRVYYEDTDAGGIVYHANYLRFMERARTEWLRALGFEQDRLLQELRVLFVVRSLEADYLKPALFNDSLEVITTVPQVRRASLLFRQEIVRNTATGESTTLLRAKVKVACLAADTLRPVAIPDAIRMEMNDVG